MSRLHNLFPKLLPPRKCPNCEQHDTFLPFLANDNNPAYVRMSVMTESEARGKKTLFGGTSFALRMFGCRNCSHVMFFYDEAATYDEPPNP